MKLSILIAIFALLATSPAPAQTAAPEDFRKELDTAAATLQGWYNSHGLWDSTGWWNAANCVEALEDTIESDNGGRYLNILDKTFDSNCQSNFLNEFYDDEGWWALAWIRAWDLTGQERFLKMSKTIFTDMAGGWSDTCGGGIWWSKKRRYKNAIANELFLLVAIRLNQRTPGDAGPGSFYDWAEREWTWFKNSGMINSRNLVNDGLNRDCQNNGRTTWSYNQGVILGALADFYRATGDTNFLAQANAIAGAAIHTLVDDRGILQDRCEKTGCRGGDAPQFKGIFIRNLKRLNDASPQQDFADFLLRNAHATWLNRDSNNCFGLRWSGPFDRADACRQSSAMAAIATISEPQIPASSVFASWPAASMDHSVGRPCGLNAWSTGPAQTCVSGILASQKLPTELPAGTWTATFWLKVDNFNFDKQPVAAIAVIDSASGKILASKNISRNEFPNILYNPFHLTFKTAPGNRCNFQTAWRQFSGAPKTAELGVSLQQSK
jgi:predicted alpha-1,6-mannanase (GH76 family)